MCPVGGAPPDETGHRGEKKGTLMKSLHRFVYAASTVLNVIAGVALISIVLVVVVNAVSRRTPLGPILGTYEYAMHLEGIVIAFALCFNQIKKVNISVDILTMRLSRRTNAIMASTMYLASMVLFGAVAYGLLSYGNDLRVSGEVSATMHVPFYPLTYAVSLCIALLVLVLLADFLDAVSEIRKNNG
jgi:TRAP-type C4-dicarboxylate transport system permease small subunit